MVRLFTAAKLVKSTNLSRLHPLLIQSICLEQIYSSICLEQRDIGVIMCNNDLNKKANLDCWCCHYLGGGQVGSSFLLVFNQTYFD